MMIRPHKDKLRAIVQARQVDDLMATGIKAAKRVSMKLWQRIAACWREGRMDFNLAEIFQSDLLDALSSACLQAHAKGFKSSTIQFDLYSETVGLLGDRATIDRLEQQYGVDCLRILSGAANNVEDALRAKMNELIEQGAHVRRGITELASTFAAQGVSPKNTFQLETIFRTQHQLAYGAGRWHADQDPDIQEILWGYKYVTVGDDRVRESHAKLDGVTMPKDDPFWQTHWPPNGWNCRCQAIPIYDERPTIAPPRGVDPDEGFAFNNGVVMSDLAAIDNPPVPDNYTPPAAPKIYVPPAPNVPPITSVAEEADQADALRKLDAYDESFEPPFPKGEPGFGELDEDTGELENPDAMLEPYGQLVGGSMFQDLDVVDVPLKGLRATQEAVMKTTVRDLISVKIDELNLDPTNQCRIVKYRGSYYIHDGHHRATAAKLRAQTTIPARVLNLDKDDVRFPKHIPTKVTPTSRLAEVLPQPPVPSQNVVEARQALEKRVDRTRARVEKKIDNADIYRQIDAVTARINGGIQDETERYAAYAELNRLQSQLK